MKDIVVKCSINQMGSMASQLKTAYIESLTLDMEALGFIESDLLTYTRCFIDAALNKNIPISIIPPRDENVKSYAGRMGLFEGTTYQYPYQERSPKDFFPLIRIENDRDSHIHDECLRVFNTANVAVNTTHRIADAFVELANNIFYHSGNIENTGVGYIHAQIFQQIKCIKLGIADTGIGFYESYARLDRLNGRDEAQIMVDAFNENESSLNDGKMINYRGIGLSDVIEFIKQNNGNLFLYSGATTVHCYHGKIKHSPSGFYLQGSLILLSVPI